MRRLIRHRVVAVDASFFEDCACESLLNASPTDDRASATTNESMCQVLLAYRCALNADADATTISMPTKPLNDNRLTLVIGPIHHVSKLASIVSSNVSIAAIIMSE